MKHLNELAQQEANSFIFEAVSKLKKWMSENNIERDDTCMTYLLDMEKKDFDSLLNDTVTDMAVSDIMKLKVLVEKSLSDWRNISKKIPFKTVIQLSNADSSKKNLKSDIESFAEKIAPEIGIDKDEILNTKKYAKFDMNNIHDDYEEALKEVENEMFNGSGDIMSKTTDELKKILNKNHWNNEFDLDSSSVNQLRSFLFHKLESAVNDRIERKNKGFKSFVDNKLKDGEGRAIIASIEDEKEAMEWLYKLLKTWC